MATQRRATEFDCAERVQHLADTLQQLALHIEKLMEERDARYEQRFASGEVAILKAETAGDKRFEGVNEFCKTLSDQTALFVPRSETEQRFSAMGEKLDGLRQRMDKHDGQGGGMRQSWGYLVSVITLLVALGALGVGIWK